MKKVWKRILTFVLAVGMLVTTNGFSELTVAYAGDARASTTCLQYTDEGGEEQTVYPSTQTEPSSIEISYQQEIELKILVPEGVTASIPQGTGTVLENSHPEIVSLTQNGNNVTVRGLAPGTSVIRIPYLVTPTYEIINFYINITVRKNLNNADISKIPDGDLNNPASYVYTGAEMHPVRLTDNGELIKEGEAYTLAYDVSNRTDTAKRIIATATGIGSYKDEWTTVFSIVSCNFGGDASVFYYDKETGTTTEYSNVKYKALLKEGASPVYNKSAQTPAVEVWAYEEGNPDKLLYKIPEVSTTGAKNYTVQYSNNILPGREAVVTVTGGTSGGLSGNCAGTFSSNFIIQAKLSDADAAVPDNIVYTNDEDGVRPQLEVSYTVNGQTKTLEEGEDKDYTVAYTNNKKAGTNIGTATISATGNGVYTGSKTVNFTIQPKNLEDNDITFTVDNQKAKAGDAKLTTSDIASSSLHVTYHGKELTPGTDFDVILTGLDSDPDANNWQPKTEHTLTIRGKGNYSGEIQAQYTLGADLSVVLLGAAITLEASATYIPTARNTSTYNGKEQEPALSTISYNGKTLTYGTDYTLRYDNNINVGTNTAIVTIVGEGEYAGEYVVRFTIKKKDIFDESDGGKVEVYIRNQDGEEELYDENNPISIEYTGQMIGPEVTKVLYTPAGGETRELGSGEFYTEYINYGTENINAGKGKQINLIVRGDNYEGTKSILYEITPIVLTENLEDLEVALSSALEYNAKPQSLPGITVTYKGKRLANTDYKIGEDTESYTNAFTFKDEEEASKALQIDKENLVENAPYVIIEGQGNYSGTIYYSYEIQPYDINRSNVEFKNGTVPDQPYTGQSIAVDASLVAKYSGFITTPSGVQLGTWEEGLKAGTNANDPDADYYLDYTGADSQGVGSNIFAKIIGINNYTGERLCGPFSIKYNIVPDQDQGQLTLTVGSQTILIKDGAVSIDGDNSSDLVSINNDEHTATCKIASQLYTGAAIKPNITLIYTSPSTSNNHTLNYESGEYTLNWENNTEVGTGSVVIKGNGNFMGTITLTFEIVKNNFDDAKIQFEQEDGTWGDTYETEYTGGERKPTIRVIKEPTDGSGSYTISESEYTVNYTNNTNVSRADSGELPTVTVTAGDKYNNPNGKTELTANFTITPADISQEGKIQVTNLVMNYTGLKATVGNDADATLKPVLLFNGHTMQYGTDYTIELPGNDDGALGTHNMVIKGTGNFTGELATEYTIQYDLSKAEFVWYQDGEVISSAPTYFYIPGGVEPKAVGKYSDGETGFQVSINGTILEPEEEYLVDYIENEQVTNSAKVHISPSKNAQNVVGEKTETFRIIANDISKITEENSGYVIDSDSLKAVYNGSEQSPKPVIKYNGVTLTEGEDYTLSYSGNRVDALAAIDPTITITGIGGFEKSATIPFTIEQKPIVINGELNEIEIDTMFFLDVLTLEGTEPTNVTIVKDPDTGEMIYCINNNKNITVDPITDRIFAQPSQVTLWDTGNGNGNQVTLRLGTDYRVEYNYPVGASEGLGRYTYMIIGMGNYTGRYELPYYVKHNFAEGENLIQITSVDFDALPVQNYTGNQITFPVSLTFNGVPVRETDYTVEYRDNIDPGEATVVIQANDSSQYYGTITKNFKIRGSLANNRVQVNPITDQFWTGEAVEPTVEVYWRKADGTLNPLVEGEDFTVSYLRNVDISDASRPSTLPTAVITGIGDYYTGETTKTFNIVKIKPINDTNITVGGLEEAYTFNGRAQTINGLSVIFKDESGNEYALQQNKDYKLEYFNNTEVGTARIVITGLDRYEGSVTKEFKILGSFSGANASVGIDPIPDQKYTGSAINPNINVFWNTASKQSLPLVEGRDYEISSITNNVEIGEASVTIRALENSSNYRGEFTATFKIVDPNEYVPPEEGKTYTIGDGTIEISNFNGKAAYTGQAITLATLSPEAKIVYRDTYQINGQENIKYIVLEEGKNYSISYSDNTEPGQATIVIDADTVTDDSFSGKATIHFDIIGDLSGENITLGDIPEQTCIGEELEPEVSVTWKGAAGDAVSLVKGRDYEVTYSNNIYPGTATATITGIGYYEGTRSVDFEIIEGDDPIDPDKILIRSDDVTLSEEDYSYDGSEKTPEVTVVVDGVTLTEGTDYTLSYQNNTNAGTATVIVAGNGEYTNTVRKTFTIAPIAIRGEDVTLLATSYSYDGTAKTPDAIVRVNGKDLYPGTDYTITYSNNTNAGTATATISGIGNYSGTVPKTFTIVATGGTSGDGKINIAETVTISGIASKYTYTGAQIKPAVSIKTSGQKALTVNKDYKIEYLNNINAGTGWLVVTGIGNYTGFAIRSFTIVKKNINNCTITLPTSAVYTGSEIRPEPTAKNGSRKMVQGSDYSYTYSNNKKLGRATVTIRGEGNFTGTKKVYFNIIVNSTKNLKVSSSKTSSVTLKWTKVAKASGYEVYTSTLKKKVATVTKNTNTVTIKKLKKGTTYKYRVRAYITQGGKKYYGAFSNTVSVSTAPKAVTAKLSSSKKNTVTIRWTKVSGNGYQIYRSVRKNSGYRKIKTLTSSSKRSYTDRRVASGGIYYYKIRAYKKSGSKYVYGAFSTSKQVTAK